MDLNFVNPSDIILPKEILTADLSCSELGTIATLIAICSGKYDAEFSTAIQNRADSEEFKAAFQSLKDKGIASVVAEGNKFTIKLNFD